MSLWFIPLLAILALIIWFGHRPGAKWLVIMLVVALIAVASFAIGSAGPASALQVMCDQLGFCV